MTIAAAAIDDALGWTLLASVGSLVQGGFEIARLVTSLGRIRLARKRRSRGDVVAGLNHTRGLERWTGRLIGSPKSVRSAQTRIMLPVFGLSALVNNTPIVAMFLPIVDGLSKRTGIAPSQLYLPMAYTATFGGVSPHEGTLSY